LDSAASQWTPLADTNSSLPADLQQANAVRVTQTELDRLRLTGITVNLLLGTTSELGWKATFTVKLDRQPVGQVQLHFGSTDTGEGTPDRRSLTFTEEDWDVEQTVTVTGVDDSIEDGPQSYEIAFTAQTGDDPAYNALSPPSSIPLTNYDDEMAFRIKTTYVPNGQSTYLAHARYYVEDDLGDPAYHAVVTTSDDESLEASDFKWYIVPGLVQEDTDTNLVSLVPVSMTDRYLRFDSDKPDRWPSCNEESTTEGRCDTGTSTGCLCVWWDGLHLEENRRYLGWLDAFEDSTTYRSDATFHLVPALNGETDLVSLRWHDSSQHVRHASYQVVAWEIASEAIEQASLELVQP
jgi:hypothetical protein